MNVNEETNKYPKYLIKKSPGLGYDHRLVAKAWVDDKGKLWYKMEVQDEDVEQVLLRAQREGGLHMFIPFSSHEGKLAIKGLKRHFVPVNDAEHFIDALEFNLKSGLVDREDMKYKSS